jgi:hypothetical protein
MAINLVSLVMQFLTPDMIGRIASALGFDRTITQRAITAAIPAILAALSKVAAQPSGAQKLADVTRQQSSVLESFANIIGKEGQSSFIGQGSQLLSSLLGGRDQNALAQAVGKFGGLGQDEASSLLGMLAPVVMGTIAQHTRPLDASGVTSLLTSQKGNIAVALPAGFSNLLSGTGVLDAIGAAARSATAAGSEAARAAGSTTRAVVDRGQPAAGAAAAASRNWLYWLIPIVAIAALLIYFLSRPAEQVGQQGVPPAQSLMVGGLDLGKQVTDSITSLRTTLSSVTDTASAQAALPRLRDATAQIDKVDSLLGQLSLEQRKSLAGIVNPMIPTLNGLFEKVLAIPGVADVLKPTIDLLKNRLAALTV